MDINRLLTRVSGDFDPALLEKSENGGRFSTGYFSDGPLTARLCEDEEVEFALQNLKRGLVVTEGGTQMRIPPGSNYRTVVLVTDRRLLFVVGRPDGDETFSVPFNRVCSMHDSRGVFKDRIRIQASDQTFDMYVKKGSPLNDIAEYVSTMSGSNENSDRSSTGLQNEAHHSSQTPASGVLSPSIRSEELSDPRLEADGSGTGSKCTQGDPASLDILVTDEAGDPVANATVSVEETAFESGGRTSSSGRCSLNLPALESSARVKVAHPAYETLRGEITVQDGAVIDVTLSESVPQQSNQDHRSDDLGGPQSSEIDDVKPSREDLVEELITLDEKSSRNVTRGRMRSDGRYEPEDYEEEFGSWSAALESVTFPDEESEGKTQSLHSNQERYSKSEVLDAIAEVVERVGRNPSINDMNKYGRMSPSPAYRYFDSWSDAVDAAARRSDRSQPSADGAEEGVNDSQSSPGNQEGYSKQEVLEAVAEVIEHVDGDPTIKDMQEYGRMTPSPAYRYFDSWSDAVDAAARWSDESRSAADGVEKDGSTYGGTTDDSPPLEDPLADGLESAPEGRLSGAIVEILDVVDIGGNIRAADVDVRIASGEIVPLDVWQRHDVDWNFEPGDRLRLDEVRLNRWNTSTSPAHKLSTTKDFSVRKVDVSSQDLPEDRPEGEAPTSVERLLGVGGATESDAKVLVDAGYETREDLEAASLEELRTIPELDDGVALRIKAELG